MTEEGRVLYRVTPRIHPKTRDQLIRLTRALSKKHSLINERMAEQAIKDSAEFKPTSVESFYEKFGKDVIIYQLVITDTRKFADKLCVVSRLYTDKSLMLRLKAIADVNLSETHIIVARVVPKEEHEEAILSTIGRTVNSRHPYTPCFIVALYDITKAEPKLLLTRKVEAPLTGSTEERRIYYYSSLPDFDPLVYSVSINLTVLSFTSGKLKNWDSIRWLIEDETKAGPAKIFKE